MQTLQMKLYFIFLSTAFIPCYIFPFVTPVFESFLKAHVIIWKLLMEATDPNTNWTDKILHNLLTPHLFPVTISKLWSLDLQKKKKI